MESAYTATHPSELPSALVSSARGKPIYHSDKGTLPVDMGAYAYISKETVAQGITRIESYGAGKCILLALLDKGNEFYVLAHVDAVRVEHLNQIVEETGHTHFEKAVIILSKEYKHIQQGEMSLAPYMLGLVKDFANSVATKVDTVYQPRDAASIRVDSEGKLSIPHAVHTSFFKGPISLNGPGNFVNANKALLRK